MPSKRDNNMNPRQCSVLRVPMLHIIQASILTCVGSVNSTLQHKSTASVQAFTWRFANHM